TIWAWGYNGDGELGNGGFSNSATPAAVSGLTNVVAIGGGVYHSLALKSDGTVWAWGKNYYGQLGNGGFSDSATPAAVSGLTNVAAIAGGGFHSLVLAAPLDSAPPTTTAAVLPSPNGAGWNNTAVTVNLTATDNAGGSGVKQITYSASGAQSIS